MTTHTLFDIHPDLSISLAYQLFRGWFRVLCNRLFGLLFGTGAMLFIVADSSLILSSESYLPKKELSLEK
jgi:hypothetical protein